MFKFPRPFRYIHGESYMSSISKLHVPSLSIYCGDCLNIIRTYNNLITRDYSHDGRELGDKLFGFL